MFKVKPLTSLTIHRVLLLLDYIFSFIMSCYLYSLIIKNSNSVDVNFILTSGALFATFGSAIIGLSLVFESDCQKRIELDLNILNKDILKDESPWRRWPFLKRNQVRKLLNGDSIALEVDNSIFLLSFVIYEKEFIIPTIFEDYFDLPFMHNLLILYNRKSQFYTDLFRYSISLKLSQSFKYECLHDIYWHIFKLRCARYGTHLGSGIIFSSLFLVLTQMF